MWLINSPIGRKVVMSVTGICLILFLTFVPCVHERRSPFLRKGLQHDL